MNEKHEPNLKKIKMSTPKGTIIGFLDESRQLIYYNYATVEFLRMLGYKWEEVKE